MCQQFCTQYDGLYLNVKFKLRTFTFKSLTKPVSKIHYGNIHILRNHLGVKESCALWAQGNVAASGRE